MPMLLLLPTTNNQQHHNTTTPESKKQEVEHNHPATAATPSALCLCAPCAYVACANTALAFVVHIAIYMHMPMGTPPTPPPHTPSSAPVLLWMMPACLHSAQPANREPPLSLRSTASHTPAFALYARRAKSRI